MDFHEFCAAALSVHQLEALDRWEQHARSAYEIFEKDGNRAIVIDELASVCDTFYSIHVHFLIDKFGICSHLLYVTCLSGTGSQPFRAAACRSTGLDPAHRWETKLPWIRQVASWHVQQVPVKDEMTVDNNL
jgi:predicted RNA methylase